MPIIQFPDAKLAGNGAFKRSKEEWRRHANGHDSGADTDYEALKAAHKASAAGEMPPDPKLFTVAFWVDRDDLPEPEFALGNLLSTTSRWILISDTGLGKTTIALAIAFAAATAKAFLHWSAGNRCMRVLYLDGEMSGRLARERLREEVKRWGFRPETLFVINRDDFEIPPLNTENGQKLVEWMIEQIGGVDLIVFDNVQALLVGSMKEDETWAGVKDWIKNLTKRKIGQIWVHHTGIDKTRGYGDKSREWESDTVAIMMKPEQPTPERLVEFTLMFTKARERAPHNRADFEPVTIWLDANNIWQSCAIDKPTAAKSEKSAKPEKRNVALELLKKLIGTEGKSLAPDAENGLQIPVLAVPEAEWLARYRKKMEEQPDKERKPETIGRTFRRHKDQLLRDNIIDVHAWMVWLKADDRTRITEN